MVLIRPAQLFSQIGDCSGICSYGVPEGSGRCTGNAVAARALFMVTKLTLSRASSALRTL